MLAEYDEAYLQGHRLKPLQIHMSQSMARHPTFPIWSMEAEAPQKLGQSHWCVPFTATFSKRRKIGAFWSERCDGCIYTFCISVPCQILTAHSFLVVPITLCSYAWHNCMRCPERERERERERKERERERRCFKIWSALPDPEEYKALQIKSTAPKLLFHIYI